MIGGDVVGRDRDNPAASPGVNPVLCQRYRLSSARTSRVDLSVRAAGADEFGELRMSHGQDSEQKTAIEDVRFFVDGSAQLSDAPLEFLHQLGMTIRLNRTGEQAFKHG